MASDLILNILFSPVFALSETIVSNDVGVSLFGVGVNDIFACNAINIVESEGSACKNGGGRKQLC